jgi:hypothetical protein
MKTLHLQLKESDRHTVELHWDSGYVAWLKANAIAGGFSFLAQFVGKMKRPFYSVGYEQCDRDYP